MTPKWATRELDDGRAGGALSEQVARGRAEVAEALRPAAGSAGQKLMVDRRDLDKHIRVPA